MKRLSGFVLHGHQEPEHYEFEGTLGDQAGDGVAEIEVRHRNYTWTPPDMADNEGTWKWSEAEQRYVKMKPRK